MAKRSGRKYGKNPTTFGNTLKLVEALLALVDGDGDRKITLPSDKLKAQFKVEWIIENHLKETHLSVSGMVEEKRNGRTKTTEKGIKKDDLLVLVEAYWGRNALNPAQNKMEAIQDVIYCLEDLGILHREKSVINQGFWKFSLTLNRQKAEKSEHLQIIKDKWKAVFGELPKLEIEKYPENPEAKDQGLDWERICRSSLPLKKDLTSNELASGAESKRKIDQVYVPLALVERRVRQERRQNGLPGQPEGKEEEKLVSISEDNFFESVLRQGRGESQGRRIAIIGEPGAGKTTRLQKIADWILEEELGLPIWIDLGLLGNQNICQYLENEWLPNRKGEVKRRDLEPQINQVWLLLDGLDEMTARIERGHVSSQLLTGWVEEARMIITCRVNVWEADKNAFSGFEVFRNLPFEPEQVESFIQKWFGDI